MLFFLSWEGGDAEAGCSHGDKGDGGCFFSSGGVLCWEQVGHSCGVEAPRGYLAANCGEFQGRPVQGEGLIVGWIRLANNIEFDGQVLVIHHKTIVPVALCTQDKAGPKRGIDAFLPMGIVLHKSMVAAVMLFPFLLYLE